MLGGLAQVCRGATLSGPKTAGRAAAYARLGLNVVQRVQENWYCLAHLRLVLHLLNAYHEKNRDRAAKHYDYVQCVVGRLSQHPVLDTVKMRAIIAADLKSLMTIQDAQ